MAERAVDARDTGVAAFVRVIRRRIVLVVACVILVPAATLALCLLAEEKYSASASLLFRDPGFDQQLFGTSFFQPSRDPAREAATNRELVGLSTVAIRVAERLDAKPPLTAGQVAERVQVEGGGESDVIEVTATDADPELAAKLANLYAEQYVAFRREADRSKILQASELVRRELDELSADQQQGARGESLRSRLEELQVLASLQTGNAELVERAGVPRTPSSPRTFRNVILAFPVALLLGLGLALLFHRLDRRISDVEDLEAIFERPVLASVPLLRDGREVDSEPFRMLRANLRYFDVERRVEVVMVTSATAGEGKTTVALNLAMAAAGVTRGRVLLLECDLRKPTIGDRMGLDNALGLSQYLAHEQTVEEAILSPESAEHLDVMLAGPMPPNPADLLESTRLSELIDSCRQDYDLIVLDTPPIGVVSDAISLLRVVDGVIVVGRLGRSSRDASSRLADQLRNLNAPVLGVVANGLKADLFGDRYGYSYGYGYQPEPSSAEPTRP